MPRFKTLCEVHIHPSQVADLVKEMDASDLCFFWQTLKEHVRYCTKQELDAIAQSAEELAAEAGRVIAERVFAETRR